MLKVFLVEDEFIVRQGIKKNVDWAGHGYDFCGEASDGELAFPMIQKLRPDIIITDIKMPFMDGLTLSRLIKKEFPWMEIILLTGYEEFAYAKEAIELGVARYLLKPISSDELLKEVDALSARIMEAQQERKIAERYQKEMQENAILERGAFFEDLVNGQNSTLQLFDRAKSLNLDISAMWYNIMLIKLQSKSHAVDEYSNHVLRISAQLPNLIEPEKFLLFDRNLEGQALLFKADSETELLKYQDEYIEKFKELVQADPGIRYYIGIGVPSNRLRELKTTFEKASQAFAHRFFDQESRIVRSASILSETPSSTDDFDLRNVNSKMLDKGKLKEFLRVGAVTEVGYFIHEFATSLGTDALKSNLFRQYIAMNAYFAVTEFLQDIQQNPDQIEQLSSDFGLSGTSDDVLSYLTRIILQAMELRDKTAVNRYGVVVEEAMRFIEQNYADEDLSLNTLASHVKFSPNHLSMIFSQQTGETFIHYLTEYRMNKAKELLRCTSQKSSAIALAVGYKDPHYFSYLFKKTQGMTPTQYRGGKNENEK